MQPSDSNYQVPPFPAFPSTSRYVPLGSVEEALTRVCRSIDASEAISLVLGPPGTGKSLLCALIAQHYHRSHDVVVLGETPLDDRNAFLRHLLHQLHVDISRVRDGDLQLAVIDRVCRADSPEGGLLIVVDEAQSLPFDVLEAIRMVTNIMRHGVPRVKAVVCGGVKLDDRLVETSMEAFTQRVATRCYLHPLNGEEAAHYIRETIRQCGADPDRTINEAALATIYHACSGVPRLINQLMTQAIDCAEEADQSMISDRIIDIAWAQLQQLPSPMVEEPRMAMESTEVEFGELEEVESSANLTENRDAVASDHSEDVSKINQYDDLVVDGDPQLWFDEESSQAALQDAPQHELDAEHESYEQELGQAFEEILNDELNEEPSFDPATAHESVFGDFEDEEDITIGRGAKRSVEQVADSVTDLEHALHQEIIGLNSDLSDLLLQPTENEAEVDVEGLIDEELFEINEPEEVVEEFITVTDDETSYGDAELSPQEASGDDPAHKRSVETSETVYSICANPGRPNDSADVASRDDSDLLVIEDEVEIRRVDAAKRYDASDQTISVDFQAMLSRMRSGS